MSPLYCPIIVKSTSFLVSIHSENIRDGWVSCPTQIQVSLLPLCAINLPEPPKSLMSPPKHHSGSLFFFHPFVQNLEGNLIFFHHLTIKVFVTLPYRVESCLVWNYVFKFLSHLFICVLVCIGTNVKEHGCGSEDNVESLALFFPHVNPRVIFRSSYSENPLSLAGV